MVFFLHLRILGSSQFSSLEGRLKTPGSAPRPTTTHLPSPLSVPTGLRPLKAGENHLAHFKHESARKFFSRDKASMAPHNRSHTGTSRPVHCREAEREREMRACMHACVRAAPLPAPLPHCHAAKLPRYSAACVRACVHVAPLPCPLLCCHAAPMPCCPAATLPWCPAACWSLPRCLLPRCLPQ